MTKLKSQPAALIHLAIGLVLVLVFLADVFTPLGVAAWVFYLVPVVVAYVLWHPQAPLYVAGITTVLLGVGLFLSQRGIPLNNAMLNRAFCLGALWSLAVIGYHFIRNKLAVRRQEWLQSGQTLLSERMVGDPQLQALAGKVLGFLTEYLHADAGAIFVEDRGVYHRLGTSGVPNPACIPERFGADEALLGRVVRDQKPLLIENVPDNYLTIGSALGRSSPRQLLIAPARVGDTVKAVLEFGFFRPVESSVPELMLRVSESIAVAVRSAQYRTRLQELLEETQRQTEELQAQSEELRVANEELEEQSRALKDSQSRLEQQQGELEASNAQLQEQSRKLEIWNDDLARAKQQLESQTRELEQASRYKSEFLANMSHELRTPLNSSLILSRLLADNREGNLTPDQVKYARTIESAGKDLLTLINDVLDLAKVEAGRLDLKPEPVVLQSLLDSLRATFHPLAEHKGLHLQTRLDPGLPETVHTDALRLEQVLKNLLSNALKFTEKGEVSLEIRRAPDNRIAFAVRDTGIGIAEHQHQIIFEPFHQADGTTNRKYGGTGLGLSISREFVRLLGGDIQISSKVGVGSTFTVSIPENLPPTATKHESRAPAPVPVAEQAATLPAPVPPGARPAPAHIEDDRSQLTAGSRTILIVEDDETFARIVYDIAHELGFQALIATTAEEALALAAQFSPSAVVLDVGLPDRSGLSVLERMKADARTRHIPVHVLSASDYTQTALAMGAVGYMLKPVKREQIIEAFEKIEDRFDRKLQRVLVVEDDQVQRDSLCRLLGSAEVETVGAHNAADCLEKLRTTSFDCMVLDLTLPDASGFSLLETLSRDDSYSYPPVIVYTGRELSPEEEQRLRRYSKSIIIKGAKSPERLLDEVTLFLHQVVSELPAEKQRMIQKARSRDTVLEGRRILVVEDDVRNVFAITSVLEPQGLRVEIARNGREALSALEQAFQPGQSPIDLVLMDIMMPEMDGLTAMREIRKRREWRKLPILALTAKAMKDDQEQAFAAGANDYMAKPLDVEKLLSLVRVWMPR